MKIIKNPWKEDFLSLVKESSKSIKITSPFIKNQICEELMKTKNKSVKIEVITNFNLSNIYNGSLDLKAIENILNNNGIVKNSSKLHSKIYLFDEKKVIITSGNLTNGGLLYNYEYGVYSEDKTLVKDVVEDFYQLSNNENTGKIKKSNLLTVKEILSKIPQQKKIILPKIDIKSDEKDDELFLINDDIISNSLKGWKQHVFNLIKMHSNSEFTLKEINYFENKLKEIYPKNNTIKDKIRQQLQFLRDIGLIEFLGNGKYRKLWR
jgi:phosphatidylserine/phosphatidylglycerophosphate/cardiolipin synthase-like enzyme